MAHSEEYEYAGMTDAEIFDAMEDDDIIDDWMASVGLVIMGKEEDDT